MHAHDGRPLTADTLYVYPTALKAASVLRERARKEGCLLGHRVTTFPELTERLAVGLDVSARVLEPALAAVVLARALAAPGTPVAFREPRRGLLHEVLRVIDELKAAFLAPADVLAIAEAVPRGPSARRLAELGRVYAAYEAGLTALGAVDRHGREWRVCEALAAAEAAGTRPGCLAGVRRIVFAEIYDFSVLQFLIATSLIRLVGDAELIAFAQPENVDATRFLERTWNRFVGDPGIGDQVLPAFVERGGRRGSLAAALRGVFAVDRPAPVPPDGSIRLVQAPSRYREVEAAVRDIRMHLERGDSPERIAILARDLTVYGDLIEDVCRRYRVPVYFRKGKPLLASGVVKTCLNVLRCVTDDFRRPRLEAILDTDYLRAGRPGLARTLRDVGFVSEAARPLTECLAHRRAALAGVEQDAASDEERRARAARDGEGLAQRGAALGALMEALATLDRRRTVDGHVRALRTVLRRLGFRPVPSGVPMTAGRDARAWQRLDEVLGLLAGVARALRIESMNLHDFVRFLLAALEPLEIDDPAERAGTVRALSILDARGLDFDRVYLLGLDDGTFPAPHPESALWPDALKREANPLAAAIVRRKLGPRGAGLPLGGLLRTAREASLEDPFLFFLALSMAEEGIVVSWPTTNENGNPTVPSPFLDELRACAAGPLPEQVLDPTAVVPPAAECGEVAELVGRAALQRWAAAGDGDPLTAALCDVPALAARIATIDRRAAIEDRRTRYLLTSRGDPGKNALADAFVGRLSGRTEPVRARVDAMRWSPSRLEALGTCGFKFFARHLLGIDDARDSDAEVGVLERGTLVHAALEALFRAHDRLPENLDAARALGRAFAAEVRERASRAIVAKDPALLEVAWRQVAEAIDELIVFEHTQQEERTAAGITVDRILETRLPCTAGTSLQIEGRPDRVDVYRRDGRPIAVRVVDYKMSGNRSRYTPMLDLDKALGKTSFQVPVYLLGALAAVPDVAPDVELSGGYLLLRADDKKELVRRFTRDELDDVAGRIVALVGSARAGRFDVDPDPCDPYCAYRPVCRYQRPPLDEETTAG